MRTEPNDLQLSIDFLAADFLKVCANFYCVLVWIHILYE